MKFNLLKKLPVAIATLAALPAFGAMDTESRISALETEMKEVRGETAMGTYGAMSATARPEVGGVGVYLLIDALYWRARMGGTEYVTTSNNNYNIQPIPQTGSLKQVDFGWDWGIRAGIGYNFDHDGWDANLVYTYFRTNSSDSTSVGQNGSLVPLKGNSAVVNGDVEDFNVANKASSSAKVLLNDLVFTLGRSYFVSSDLSFRPSIGLRSTWLSLQQNTSYSGGPDLSIHVVKNNNDEDFWGIGPNFAVDGKWHLGRGFSFFGDLGFALLYGQFDVKHNNSYSGLNPQLNVGGGGNQNALHQVKLSADKHALTPMTRMVLGLCYDLYLDSDKQHLGIKLGYETSYWWNVQKFVDVTNSIGTDQGTQSVRYGHANEDLGLQGLTLEVRWDF